MNFKNVDQAIRLKHVDLEMNKRTVLMDTGGIVDRGYCEEILNHYGIDALTLIPPITMAMNSTNNTSHWFDIMGGYIDTLTEFSQSEDGDDVIADLCTTDFIDRCNVFSRQVGKWIKSNYSNSGILTKVEVLEDIEFKNDFILAIPCIIEDPEVLSNATKERTIYYPNPPQY